MRIPKDELIAGVSPAILKRLAKQETFDTPSAMKLLALPEPRASEVLAKLCLDGWIDFTGTKDFIDWWECGPRGQRLSATRILGRIPIEQGRAILQKAIARARELNAERDRSSRIAKIVLFGSLLDRTNESIGDVDIAVECARRHMSEPDLKAIEKKERASAPHSINFFQSLCWGETQILREIRTVSRHISLHSVNDIKTTGAAHRIVYAYDVDTEREITPTGKTVASVAATIDEDQDLERHLPDSRALTNPRPWPGYLDEPVEVTIDQDQENLAQHLWANGAPLEVVAERCHLNPDTARMYLSWQNDGPIRFACPDFDSNLKAMIAMTYPATAPTVVADVGIHMGEARIKIALWDDQEDSYTKLWSGRSHKAIRTSRDDLRRQAEVVHRTVVSWLDKVRPKVVGLSLRASVVLSSDLLESTTPSRATFPRLRSLASVMRRALAHDRSSEWRKHPYDFRLTCAFRPNRVETRLERCKGSNEWSRVRSNAITRRTIVETATALLGANLSWLDGFAEFEVSVDGLDCEIEPRVSELEGLPVDH